MDGTMYDRIVLTLIFMVDSLSLFIMVYRKHKTRKRAQNTRRFNRVLQSIGL